MNVEKAYVCILYDSQCAPLLLPWLGEVEGTSLAIAQGKASPVPALLAMYRVPPVLQRVPSRVPPAVKNARIHNLRARTTPERLRVTHPNLIRALGSY